MRTPALVFLAMVGTVLTGCSDGGFSWSQGDLAAQPPADVDQKPPSFHEQPFAKAHIDHSLDMLFGLIQAKPFAAAVALTSVVPPEAFEPRALGVGILVEEQPLAGGPDGRQLDYACRDGGTAMVVRSGPPENTHRVSVEGCRFAGVSYQGRYTLVRSSRERVLLFDPVFQMRAGLPTVEFALANRLLVGPHVESLDEGGSLDWQVDSYRASASARAVDAVDSYQASLSFSRAKTHEFSIQTDSGAASRLAHTGWHDIRENKIDHGVTARLFAVNFRANAPWTGGQWLEVQTSEPFYESGLVSPYRVGSLTATLENGSRLAINAATGDPTTFELTIAMNGELRTETHQWSERWWLPCDYQPARGTFGTDFAC